MRITAKIQAKSISKVQILKNFLESAKVRELIEHGYPQCRDTAIVGAIWLWNTLPSTERWPSLIGNSKENTLKLEAYHPMASARPSTRPAACLSVTYQQACRRRPTAASLPDCRFGLRVSGGVSLQFDVSDSPALPDSCADD